MAYLLFGVNRIERDARSHPIEHWMTFQESMHVERQQLRDILGDHNHIIPIAAVLDRIGREDLLAGNHIETLASGEPAFSAMLQDIGKAQKSITLASYIFKNDAVGKAFAQALANAQDRGVQIRVLIDNAGEHYSFPPISRVLKRYQINVSRFNPPRLSIQRLITMNLRNHRKLMIIDGSRAYTGGMNIQAAHLQTKAIDEQVRDTHFALEGPIVRQLQTVFAHDWTFATGERLQGAPWFLENYEAKGEILARAVPNGPDQQDMSKLHWTLLAAINSAWRSLYIVTPYFLPATSYIDALNLAALRGVAVNIVLPMRNNLPFMKWAAQAQIEPLLYGGCRIWQTDGPFDHSKLMIVDDTWSLIGSANWDARSIRLNFELNVECYQTAFAHEIVQRIEERIAAATPVSLPGLQQRSLPVKLRDRLAWLMLPLL